MKKLLLTLAVLCGTVSGWAQLVKTSTAETPIYYVMASYNRGGVITYGEVGSAVEHKACTENGKSEWYFEAVPESDNGVYIVSKYKDGENKVYLGSDKKASTTPAVWYILKNGVNEEGYSISSTAKISSYSCLDASQDNSSIGGWSPAAGDWHGTTWVFYVVNNAVYNPNNLLIQKGEGGRNITSITVDNETKTTSATAGLAYVDHTSRIEFEVFAGREVEISIGRKGNWMHAFVYVDNDADGFTVEDAVSYSYLSSTGQNSAGESVNNNTIVLPNFTAPSTPGTYRMRVKYDWDDLEPNGTENKIDKAGGQFVDVMLNVVDLRSKINQTIAEIPSLFGAVTLQTTNASGAFYLSAVTDADGNNLSKAIDGDPSTFYGSIWGASLGYAHYWQVDLVEADNLADFTFSYTTRDDGRDMPTQINVKGSNDGGVFEDIVTISENLPDAANETYTSTIIKNGGYRYIRFEVPSTNTNYHPGGNTNETTIAIAEFSMMNMDVNSYGSEVAEAIADAQSKVADMTTSVDDLYEVYQTLCNIITYKPVLQDLIKRAKAIEGGTAVGSYTDASVAALQEVIASAENAMLDKNYSTEALQSAIDALQIVMPSADKFYVLKCNYEGRYIHVNADNKLNYVANANANTADGRYVWQFVPSEGGKFKMKSVHNQTYIGELVNNSAISLNETGSDITISKGNVLGTVKFEGSNAGVGIHANSNPVIGYTNGAGANHYFVEEVNSFSYTLSVGDAKWSSLMLGYNAEIPASVKAYVVETVNAESVKLAEVSGVLAANTPVLVNAEKEKYTFAYSTEEATVTNNGKLAGTLYDTNVTADAYVLSMVESNVGLYKAEKNQLEGTAFKNNANKAYLPAENIPVGARFLSFDFGTETAIESIESVENNAVVYDLAGRRVQNAQKGVFIVNGKVIVK